MEVILLEKMRHLGELGEKVKVKPGFARNYLIPQGKAVYATAINLAKVEERRAELEKLAAKRHGEALARQKTIEDLSGITLTAKVGEEGKLFGSIGARDIVDAIKKAGVTVERREIRLPSEGVIRLAGEYDITIDLESNITAKIKVKIVGEG